MAYPDFVTPNCLRFPENGRPSWVKCDPCYDSGRVGQQCSRSDGWEMERETGIEAATSSLGIFPSRDAASSRKGAKAHEYWQFPMLRASCIFVHPYATVAIRLRFVGKFVGKTFPDVLKGGPGCKLGESQPHRRSKATSNFCNLADSVVEQAQYDLWKSNRAKRRSEHRRKHRLSAASKTCDPPGEKVNPATLADGQSTSLYWKRCTRRSRISPNCLRKLHSTP